MGFIAGGAGGGFLGLVVGGTFLGWIDFHSLIGLEGYELTFYLGLIAGSIAGSFWAIYSKNRKSE